MDNLNFNKIAAGVLCGGLLLMAGIKAGEIFLPHQELEENAYPFEVAEAENDGLNSAQAVEEVGPEPILAMLASADIAAGQALSKNVLPVMCLMKVAPIRLALIFTILLIVMLRRLLILSIPVL